MSEIVLSVIIPHYNIPDLLVRCLNSIPIREDIQVIVVDDCSDDYEQYIKKIPELSRPYLELYQTHIGGSAGRARNVGIEHAKGRWITFVDADDLFVESIDMLIDKYIDKEEDVLYFPSISVMSDNLDIMSKRHCFHYHFEQYFNGNNENFLRYEFDAPWGKFIKKYLIDKNCLRFDEVKWANDAYFSACVGVYAKSIYVPREVAYIVTEREGSLTSAKVMSVNEWKVRLSSSLRVQNLFDENNIQHKRYSFIEIFLLMWPREKRLSILTFLTFSYRNKLRVIYSILRNYKNKVIVLINR